MLAKNRRGPRNLPWRAGKLDRQAERAGASGAGMFQLDHHLARERLGVGGEVGDRVDRAAGHTRRLERGEQLAEVALPDARAHQFDQRWQVLHALGVVAEAWILE